MFCLANCVLLTLRINSSDLPENILPQITSTQPVCFIISIRWPLLSYLSSPDFYKEIIYFYTNQLNTDLVFFFIKLNIKTTNFYGIPQLNYPFLAIKKQASNSCPSLFGLLVQLQAAETRGQITSNHGSYKPNFLG